MMKNTYLNPEIMMISVSNEDVLTGSGDVTLTDGRINKKLGTGERGMLDGLELGI